MMLITLLHFYFLIFECCFSNDSTNENTYHDLYLKWVLLLIPTFTIDILLKLNAGYFINGLQMIERTAVIQRYIKSEFLFDSLAMLSLILDYSQDSLTYLKGFESLLKLIFFFKYPILNQLIRNVEEIINFDEKIVAFISLSKLFIKMIFLAHIIACFWFTLPKLAATSTDTNWMQVKGIMEKTTAMKYEISLYWAIVTIATIGYGDITPQNEYEYLFTACVAIIGSIFFGYSLSFIASIFEDLQKEERVKMLNILE